MPPPAVHDHWSEEEHRGDATQLIGDAHASDDGSRRMVLNEWIVVAASRSAVCFFFTMVQSTANVGLEVDELVVPYVQRCLADAAGAPDERDSAAAQTIGSALYHLLFAPIAGDSTAAAVSGGDPEPAAAVGRAPTAAGSSPLPPLAVMQSLRFGMLGADGVARLSTAIVVNPSTAERPGCLSDLRMGASAHTGAPCETCRRTHHHCRRSLLLWEQKKKIENRRTRESEGKRNARPTASAPDTSDAYCSRTPSSTRCSRVCLPPSCSACASTATDSVCRRGTSRRRRRCLRLAGRCRASRPWPPCAADNPSACSAAPRGS